MRIYYARKTKAAESAARDDAVTPRSADCENEAAPFAEAEPAVGAAAPVPRTICVGSEPSKNTQEKHQ